MRTGCITKVTFKTLLFGKFQTFDINAASDFIDGCIRRRSYQYARETAVQLAIHVQDAKNHLDDNVRFASSCKSE